MIARKSVLILSSQFFVRFLGWISIVVLAKLWEDFSVEALGIIGFAMAFLAIFNIIGDLGFTSAHIKRVSEKRDLGTCIGTFAAIKLLLSGVMVAVILLAIFVWKVVLHQDFTDATTESIIYVFILYYVISNVQRIATITFEARKETAKQQISAMFEGVVKVPLMILVAVAGVSAGSFYIAPAFEWPQFLEPRQHFLASHPVGSLAMAYVFGISATLLVGLLFLRKYPISRPSLELGKSYFQENILYDPSQTSRK